MVPLTHLSYNSLLPLSTILQQRQHDTQTKGVIATTIMLPSVMEWSSLDSPQHAGNKFILIVTKQPILLSQLDSPFQEPWPIRETSTSTETRTDEGHAISSLYFLFRGSTAIDYELKNLMVMAYISATQVRHF